MLEKGLVEIVHDQVPAFNSKLFLVEKAMGLGRERDWRSGISVWPLSTFVALLKFRMEMVTSVLSSNLEGRLQFLIDLKDMYF